MTRATAITLIAALTAACAADAASTPQPAPLTTDQLSQCAAQIQKLRNQSPPLNRRAKNLDARRARLHQLAAQAKAGKSGDGTADNSQEPWINYNAKAKAFNDDMAKFRDDVTAIDIIKRNYQNNCAGHPFRHQDLAALPTAAQQAMRVGLGDIRVPYTTGNAAAALDESPHP